jgi:hypothetical protein
MNDTPSLTLGNTPLAKNTKTNLRISLTVLKTWIMLVLVSACGEKRPTPLLFLTAIPGAEPVIVELNVSSVAGKGETTLAQDSLASWDRVAIHWQEVQRDVQTWDLSHIERALSDEPLEHVLVVLTGYPRRKSWNDAGVAAPVDIDPGCSIEHVQRGGHAYCVVFRGLDQEPYHPDGIINQDNFWAYYVYQVVTSPHAGKVGAWQIWNEVDWIVPSCWDYAKNEEMDQTYTYWPAPSYYLDVVETAYQVIHKERPSDKVILGGPIEGHMWAMIDIGNTPWSETWRQEWYKNVLEELPSHPVAKHLDAIGLHLYRYPSRARDYVQAVGERVRGIPIWFTESGWKNALGQSPPACRPAERAHCAPDNAAASYLLQQYAYTAQALQRLGMSGKIFHFSFRDLPEGGIGQEVEGLVSGMTKEQAGEPRPSYFAFQFIQRELIGLDFDGWSGDEAAFTFMAFTRQRDGARVFLVWNNTSIPIENAAIPAHGVQCASLFDQRGVQIDLRGNPSHRCITSDKGYFYVPLPETQEPEVVGGPTFVLIETIK